MISDSFRRYQKTCNRSVSSEISASELSYLTAQVWTLENRLREEKRCTLNLTVSRYLLQLPIPKNTFIFDQESIQSVVNEKYELLHELTCQKQLFQRQYDDLQRERLVDCDKIIYCVGSANSLRQFTQREQYGAAE